MSRDGMVYVMVELNDDVNNKRRGLVEDQARLAELQVATALGRTRRHRE